ncbi:MAG: hypothetical protein HZB65_04540 [Candidatus Aenigmarchaeota archaeon]|nr:hypothetical protein [Candidatus Aenigmarchaeota archaeon]
MALEVSERDIKKIERGQKKIPCVGCGKPIKNRSLYAYVSAIESGCDNPQPICYRGSEPDTTCAEKFYKRQTQLGLYSAN